MSTFIIAEAGVNHNGELSRALEMVEVAAASGADAIKFQSFDADKVVVRGAAKAEYQRQRTGEADQHSMLHALELSPAAHREIAARCARNSIEFMSTPFDEDSADMLLELGMQRIKVASGELTNEPFLAFLAAKGRSMIVSSGMATLAEIRRAVEVIGTARGQAGHTDALAQALTILHCTSSYPAACSDVNLRAMQTIAQETGLPVGYSDHTLGLAVSTAAVALGAGVIEKHFTLDRNLAGPDHQASLVPDELRALVRQIRDVEAALGSPIKEPSAAELPLRALARRSIIAVRELPAGAVLLRSDLTLLRPGTGIAPGEIDRVVGRTVVRDLPAGTVLQWSDVE